MMRIKSSKQADSSAVIIDSKSVKTDKPSKSKDYDADKKKGENSISQFDILGLLLIAKITADVQN